ncbi:MAG: hypothetical protein ABI831_01435 [Betaproteobacteria bacterium]
MSMIRKAAFAIAYGVAIVPFLVGAIVANLSNANMRMSIPFGAIGQAVAASPAGRSDCDRLAEPERGSCREALEAARRDEAAPTSGEPALNMIRARNRAEIDAGDADRMVAKPACEVEARRRNSVCELQLEALPVRMLTA